MNFPSNYGLSVIISYLIILIIYLIGLCFNNRKFSKNNNNYDLEKYNKVFIYICMLICFVSTIFGIIFSIQTKDIKYIGEMLGIFPFYVIFIKSSYYDTYIGTAGCKAFKLLLITAILVIVTQVIANRFSFISDPVIEYGVASIIICMILCLIYLFAPLLSKYKQDIFYKAYITYLSFYINSFIMFVLLPNIKNNDSNTTISSIIVFFCLLVTMFEKIDIFAGYLLEDAKAQRTK